MCYKFEEVFMKILLASNNKDKIREFREVFTPYEVEILSLKDLNINVDPEENGTTFKENALIKAQTLCNMINKPTLADDSGLEVDAMDKAPGIYSARFMGYDTSYDIKNQAIIDAVEGKDRTARFVCAMALCIPGEEPILIEETFEGQIHTCIEGENGFGYDPIFFVPELNKTSASLTLEEKNQYSHRAKALKKLYQILKEKE
jgi:XTP/dITP diphosphohydrolase